MNKKLAIVLTSSVLLTLPAMILAVNLPGGQPNPPSGTVQGVINGILNLLWPIFVGFAVIMFLVAGFLFLSANGDPGKVGAARQALLWGAVGVVVGLIAFVLPFVILNTIG